MSIIARMQVSLIEVFVTSDAFHKTCKEMSHVWNEDCPRKSRERVYKVICSLPR